MGLGAPRKRAKISHDPNNTNWSKCSTSYGRKMLLSQGWTPGSFLGAIDAPHAHLHSDANASHIRVAVKDDNLGLGAKRGSGVNAGECVGLDVFQSLLGRLNGKSEDVLKKEQQSRDDLKRAIYTERRWGALRFVSGGVLVGDKIERLAEAEKLRVTGNMAQPGALKPSSDPPSQNGAVEDVHLSPPLDPKLSNGDEFSTSMTEKPQGNGTPRVDYDEATVSILKAKKRAEKAQMKLDRRKRKEERRAARAAQAPADVLATTNPVPSHKFDIPIENDDGESRPVSVPNDATVLGGRHAIRNRYIMHKRMAMMDPKALNEVSTPYSQASSLQTANLVSSDFDD
ncbi:telomerase inhibitor [Xylographa carneopallida]|nr:telomerase inhibitor [Xylographa carneopallida]